jgi:hypothetical protein
MKIPAIHCRRNARFHRDIWLGTTRPSPYNPDSPPSDFHVSLNLKTFLDGRRFYDDNESKEAFNTWFTSQAASLYDAGIQKPGAPYDKCLNDGENYVEK